MPNVLPITVAEFGRALASCRPPNGWGSAITIAVSGGSDSLGMLWLLRTLYKEAGIREPHLHGVTIDHGFRPESSNEAYEVGAFCKDMGIDHRIVKVPWGTDPWPALREGGRYEEEARQARYWGFFQTMKELGSNTLLTGHQADDQLETAILRGEKGSGLLGMLGMRKIRRYGMGGPEAWRQFGVDGLQRWMCRPLLSFSKERLKATCLANSIPWMEDESNHDPTLTRRNAIRQTLAQLRAEGTSSPWSERLKRFDMKDECRDELAGVLDTLPPTAETSELTEQMSAVYDEIEAAVTTYLSSITTVEPSAPMLVVNTTYPPPSERVGFAALMRILRYVSPMWWGHPASEASRRSDSLRRLSDNLWYRSPGLDGLYHAAPFGIGSSVHWTPKERDSRTKTIPWMATRARPFKAKERELFTDLSPLILQSAETRAPPAPLLWDNRYLVRIPAGFPPSVLSALQQGKARVILGPHSKFFLPMVNFEQGEESTVLAGLGTDGKLQTPVAPRGWGFEWIRPFNDT